MALDLVKESWPNKITSLTIGATADEAARTLLTAGAKRVTVAVLAKAETPRAYSHVLER